MRVFLLSLLGALLFFGLLYFLIQTRYVPHTQVHQRLREMKYGAMPAQGTGLADFREIPFWQRTLMPMVRALERGLQHMAPKDLRASLEKRIMLAGRQGSWSVNRLVSIWVLCMLAGFFLGVTFVSHHNYVFVQNVGIILLGVIWGAVTPFAFLNTMIKRRQSMILRQLPEVLDLLCVSVQAGLSFEGSLGKIVARMQGPLIDECKRMMNDVRMGMTRRRSLKSMAIRCEIQEVQLFTAAIIQSERLGTSMATTLVNQAANMRERRRQHAKAEALRAPVKIVFPLVLFIFPALFVIVLLPTLLLLMKNM